MGYDKNWLSKKCGEILMKIKLKKNAKLILSFNCAFCNANCDQLKKFILHLNKEHSQHFIEETAKLSPQDIAQNEEKIKDELDTHVPEIKIEELIPEEATSTAGGDVKIELLSNITSVEDDCNEDPLETTAMATRRSLRTVSTKADLKVDYVNHETSDDYCVANVDYEDSVDESGSETEYNNDDNMEDENVTNSRKLSDLSDMSTDEEDLDFNIITGKATTPKNMTKKQELLEKEITKAMLEALKEQPVLWDIKLRSNNKDIRRKAFCAISKEVNDKLQTQIKWIDVRARIQHLRNEYTAEYEKVTKGETFEMPWYADSMKFLEENVKALLISRDKKRKYRRLNKLDDSHTHILIEYYKNHEILWQVNNIAFFVNTQRKEAIKRIIEDLKAKHNIDVTVHGMQRRLDYINRLYSADKEQQLACEMNNTIFVASSKYYADLLFLGDSQGPFKCPHCNEIISKYESYHQHLAKHTNSLPFKCTVCEKHFDKLDKYSIHAKYHLDLKKFHCDVCGKIFPYRSSLRLHMFEHTGIEPYLCEICGASFRASNSYDNHIRRHEKRFRYECDICKAGFNHKHSLEAHVKVHLNIRDILCNVCGKGFTAKKHLQRHQLIHSGIKRYKCDVCGKAFAQDAGLRAHRKQHIEYRSLAGEARKTAFRKGYYKYNE